MFTFAFMQYPYLVRILFGMPSLHLFTFLMFLSLVLEKEGGKGEGNAEESCHTPHRSDSQEESDGSTPTVVQHTSLRHQR